MLKWIILVSVLVSVAADAEEQEIATETEKPIVRILSFRNEQNVDGSYRFEYESEDGSKRFEQGYYKDTDKSADGKAQVVEGSYSYTDPNGELVNIQYVADENGFRPQGNIIHPAITKYLHDLEAESSNDNNNNTFNDNNIVTEDIGINNEHEQHYQESENAAAATIPAAPEEPAQTTDFEPNQQP